MNHDPKVTQVNGKPAPWNAEIRALWARVVAAHFEGEKRPTTLANYFTPRPYVDQYNTGSDTSGFTYVVGRDVGQHLFARGSRPVSYAAEVIADNSGKWVGNALRFVTEEEAEVYVQALMMRWTAVRDTRVVPSSDPVTVKVTYDDGVTP